MSAVGIEWVALPALDPESAESLGLELAAMDPWKTLGSSAEALACGLRTPHPELTRYLALGREKMLGLAAVRCPWLRGAYVELFVVLPPAQGQGLGKALMDHVEGIYRERTANLWLLVSAFNDRARRFYASRGFVPVGTLDDLVIEGQDEILMRKRL